MKTIALSKALRPLAEYARGLGKDIVVLTDHNKPVAAVVPLKDADRESIALSGHPEFLSLIARARREFAVGNTLSMEEMKRALSSTRPARKRTRRLREGSARPNGRHRKTGAR